MTNKELMNDMKKLHTTIQDMRDKDKNKLVYLNDLVKESGYTRTHVLHLIDKLLSAKIYIGEVITTS